MMRIPFSLAAVLGVFLLVEPVAAAQRTFVSAAAGNDANPCTRPLPCRNFAAAFLQTDPNGELIALDSGGYGSITISRSVSIIAPPGVHAAINAVSAIPLVGQAITVDALEGSHVVLRNLVLNNQSAFRGIRVLSVGALYVDSCVMKDFVFGIDFQPSNAQSRLHVSDTTVRGLGGAGRTIGTGISVGGGSGTQVRTILDSVRVHQNPGGIRIGDAEATIRKSIVSDGGNFGFSAESGSKIVLENSVASNSDVGFRARDGGSMILTRCIAISNNNGVQASNGTVYVTGSTITGNGTGLTTNTGGIIKSRGNNTLQANTTNGTSVPFNPN